MLEGVKKFLKAHLFTDAHPFFMGLWLDRMERKFRREERHSHMTYAEIEAEISQQYEAMFGRKLNWDNPQTYNEKIHVSKLYMPSPLKARLADKVAVREWIAEKIGGEYLVPLIGVYDSFDDIDFDALPQQFVIKCSHDSGSVILVKDKRKLNMRLLKRKYDLHMGRNFAWMGFELHYRDIPHKIIIERYLGDAINDYKFLCPGGKPFVCQVDFNRFTNHTRDFYSPEWKLQPFTCGPIPRSGKEHPMPPEYPKMAGIASRLSEGFDQVRVDLYLVSGRIYFGEMTFADGNGLEPYMPDEWEYKLGELWPFDNTARTRVLAEHSRP